MSVHNEGDKDDDTNDVKITIKVKTAIDQGGEWRYSHHRHNKAMMVIIITMEAEMNIIIKMIKVV